MKDKFRKRGSSQIFVCPIASQFTYAGSKFNVTKKKIHLILSILYSLAIQSQALDSWCQGDDVGRTKFFHQQRLFTKVVTFLQRPDLVLFQFSCIDNQQEASFIPRPNSQKRQLNKLNRSRTNRFPWLGLPSTRGKRFCCFLYKEKDTQW